MTKLRPVAMESEFSEKFSAVMNELHCVLKRQSPLLLLASAFPAMGVALACEALAMSNKAVKIGFQGDPDIGQPPAATENYNTFPVSCVCDHITSPHKIV